LAPQTPLFERENGQPDSLWNAGMRFNTLFRRCGFKPPRGSGRVGLRVHDLRHSSGTAIIPATDGRSAYFPEDRAIWDVLMAA
jgi:hypothetical protein